MCSYGTVNQSGLNMSPRNNMKQYSKIKSLKSETLWSQTASLKSAFKRQTINGKLARRAFTLVELLIVVSILGILAAIVLPEFQGHAQKAKESAAKDNLRILRETIERYALDHNGTPPGYPSDNPSSLPIMVAFRTKIINENYLNDIPENPFNHIDTFRMINNDASFPAAATGEYGWVYQPQTKTIKLDWPGTDSEGELYFDY